MAHPRLTERCIPMRSGLNRAFILAAYLALGAALGHVCYAERGYVLVQVEDTAHKPVRALEIGIDGPGGSSALTDDHGGAKLALGSAAKEGDWLSLVIRHSPPGTALDKQFVMISPWDSRAQVPSFESKPENFIRVVVMHREDRAAIEDGRALASLTAKINKANSPKFAGAQAPREDPRANLDAVAKQYGLDPDDLDRAIRAWAAKTTDTYEAGLGALYERDFAKASAQLQSSLKQREERLSTDQATVAQDQQQVADSAFFLGSSLYEQGKYRESARAFQRCLQIRSGDPAVLNRTGLSLAEAGDYRGAEPYIRQGLAIRENALGPDHPDVGESRNNLAELLVHEGRFAGAESMLREALAIREKALGPDHPDVAQSLNNLAELLSLEGRYTEAEPLYCRALAVIRRALGPNHPEVAGSLSNLGVLFEHEGDNARAEPLLRRALEIDEKSLGPDHPDLATVLNNLATLLCAKGEYAEAAPLYDRARAIREKTLGPDHPDLATDYNNLAALLYAEGDLSGAERQLHRALVIDEKALGPDHPQVAISLSNLARVLYGEGDHTGAEKSLRRAIRIDLAALGPDHPTTKQLQLDLDVLLEAGRNKEK